MLRLLIIADDPLARGGLALSLASADGCEVAGQESGETDLLAAVDLHRPDVLLWDLGWDPDEPALAAALERLAAASDLLPPVLALLPDEDEGVAAAVWGAGARGLLPRDAAVEIVLQALQAIAAGLAVLDPRLATALQRGVEGDPPDLIEELTPREMEVLRLLAEGLPNKGIAGELGISEHTVKFHVAAIMGKLGAQSRTDAVVRATRLGLILL